jgi:diguanylate cyclase (GGDEF)-like protein/PAS domain S-box-containing protein
MNSELELFQQCAEREREGRLTAERLLQERTQALRDSNKQLRLVASDLAAKMHAMNDAQIELRLFEKIFQTVSESIVITTLDGTITHVNNTYLQTTGYALHEVIGQNPRMSSSGLHSTAYFQAMWLSIEEIGSWQGEIWDKRRNGEIYPKWLSIDTVYDDDGLPQRYVGIFMDLSDIKATEKQLETMAYYDRLTNLPNRRLLLDHLEELVGSQERGEFNAALFFLDLDGFKKINDLFGHRIGDQLLVEVANRLRQCVPANDIVGRLAGDEFLILMEFLGADYLAAAEHAVMLAEQVVEVLGGSYQLQDRVVQTSASIGITLFSQSSGDTVETLLTKADTAMYEAKKSGRGSIRFFDPDMQKALSVRTQLERKLQRAVETGSFKLVFQPQVDYNGQVVGAEALIRWFDDELGAISPVQFIPLAEEMHLIEDIGRWLLAEVCQLLQEWSKDSLFRSIPIAVNISGEHFNADHFADELHAVVQRYQVSPAQIKIELTESTVVKNIEESIAKMQLLQQYGFRFSMDDFGTGYSSLSYLRRLPFDQIKIDQSFVRDMLEDASDAFIVHSVINLTEMLQIEAIPEGVETEAHYRRLIDMGARLFQGYLFSKPLPREECEAFIRSRAV